jgi:signal transduction histidine kinase/CheY-like chemotaxis protein
LERRQAFLLQLILIVLAGVFLLGAISNLARGTATSPYANFFAAVISLGLIVALRRGFFRWVAAAAVGLLILGFGSALAASSTAAVAGYLALLMLPVVIAGLLLPRPWFLAATIAVVIAGELALRAGPDATTNLEAAGGNFLYATLLIAVVVDQFGGTVRQALRRTVAHEKELEVARTALEARTGELEAAVTALQSEIQEREKAEAERLAMEARVLEVQKLESLGVLAGGIAHDFNNLLVGMLGNAGLALLELPPDSQAREPITEIEIAARRAADLSREMLAYSGRGKFVIAPFDLSALVREMTHLLHVSIGKSVVIRYDLAPQPVIVEGDATQLRQVVMNLVVNASDAIGERNGVITLTTGVMAADRSYLASTFVDEGLAPGDYAYLEVSDTGSGMDAATQARIFDPFFTTKFTGRGLGLAAVLGIVRSHRGALKVYSEPGKGSTFKLLIPASQEAAPDAPTAPAPSKARLSGCVLVVDDEPVVRSVAVAILRRLGLEIVEAVDGEAGVAAFRDEPDRFGLVLLDLTMPRLGGADAFTQIRALRPKVPVVLMSGFNEADASGRFAGKGLAGFLEKPFSPQDLTRVVEEALRTGPTGTVASRENGTP